jgi:predicted nucleic acid-binding Zn ribbon protein
MVSAKEIQQGGIGPTDSWREIISKRQRITKQYMSLLFYKLIVIIL